MFLRLFKLFSDSKVFQKFPKTFPKPTAKIMNVMNNYLLTDASINTGKYKYLGFRNALPTSGFWFCICPYRNVNQS